MCLEVSRIHHPFLKPKVARKDIPCFKLLSVETKKEFPYAPYDTFILHTPIAIKAIEEEDIFVSLQGDNPDSWKTKKRDYIGGGAIHSFRTYKEARKMQTHNTNYFECIILLAYIPKGTKYYIGKDNDYASEMIKFY